MEHGLELDHNSIGIKNKLQGQFTSSSAIGWT